ncbi:Rmf/CrpP family protein [Antarcticirhabdus aurantiaca]|uniref:Uncharacterized protein n=1 Tax=Antarcticirhabdus aurantiaca TaxID=2606717 RepID=A0ACD4NU21_9HYPH|nr:Rmf/CrpP family protein [Antarcticirhabdus aurantiaca]WAJ30535.1 hypothetical protein OXU80_10155 [Jeongeuplla avenae]
MATDAFEQGKLAFAHNIPMSACEYPVSSSLRSDWMSGWTQARNASPSTGHPGMMGDGTEEQNLNQRGNPEARISEDEVDAAFGQRKH